MGEARENTAARGTVARIVSSVDPCCSKALRGASCAFGVFDGVHRGHRFIIDCALAESRERSCACAVITFDHDPDELFCPDRLDKIMTNGERIETLAHTGVDFVIVIPFTREFASQSPEEFLDAMFGRALPAAVHIGCDFRFGARAAGTLSTLEEWGSAQGVHVVGHELLEVDGAPVTSTRIRKLMAEGKREEAEKLLDRPLLR